MFDNNTQLVRTMAYGRLSVLVVEDDELAQARLEYLLNGADFDVLSVSSAHEARQAMEALVFPIVIVDRQLGDIDGIELMSDLRRTYANHRVYLAIYSALDSVEEQQKAIAAGADAYFSKHASDEALVTGVFEARTMVRLSKQALACPPC